MILNLAHKPTKTIIVAGSGRGGTTWLGNIIAANPNVRIIFEPFDRRRVPQASTFPLRPYARPNEKYPEWESIVQNILKGQIHNEWVNRQGYRWWANRLMVKDIRVNLMLGWLSEVFNPRIVYVIRHPCAVVYSRFKLDWETHIEDILSQDQLVADFLEPFMGIITDTDTVVKKHAVMWCTENLIPLRQLPYHDWIFCTYEGLYCKPEEEADRILDLLKIRNTCFTKRAIQRISMVTRSDSDIRGGHNPVSEWKRFLSNQDIKSILEIVEAFGIDIYGADVLPLSNRIIN
jgi:hypothetical protein